ncbi:hypothetical protein Syun_018772 [Stephania yunnanensis]|uniref:Uncharacterized protein n=1 Tax=Stephania yunnanensis TaxID=152371 RepID=A0AAP0ITZ4_9MAGN
MMLTRLIWVLLLILVVVSAKKHENPANELVNLINENRTAQKLLKLNESPGLGCIALQYIEECKSNCTSNDTVTCKPSEDDFTEVFAPNCGMELPTFGTISGRIVACHSKYLEPSEAFSHIFAQDKKLLSVLKDKKHTEVGIGLVGMRHGPFFWSVLFSSDQVNSTFVLEDLGKGIKQKQGCFSGADFPCSAADSISLFLNPMPIIFILFIYRIL